jgi:histidine triad (HIT) family protein
VSGAADCVFCRIIAGEIPANVVAESEEVVAFRDLSPGAPTHVLVVPKQHLADASVLNEGHGALLGAMTALATRVAEREGVASSGYRLVFNVGEDAGNTIGHLHLHVLGGRPMHWPPG